MIQSFVRDISERKRADAERIKGEQALRLAQEQMSLSQQLGHTGSWVYDLATNTISGSAEAHRIFGLFPVSSDMSLDDIESCIPERVRVHEALLALIREERKYDIEYAINPKDGSPPRVIQAIARLEKDARGNPIGVLGFIQDVTERKRAETDKASLEASLRESQKMEALGTLAGGVAHDFNNALAAILGNVELARQDVGPDHAALVSLEEIDKASRRAKDLVQQILAFGRRQKLERKVMSLALVVVETARLVRATLPAMVSLSVDCKGDTPPVLADATAVKQILLNLCSNASQAVQEHERPGAIEIRLEAHTQAEARGSLHPGRYACLTVQDNGAGMDEMTRSHIFEPFFTTKQAGKGTGLGLSVVHGMVQTHEASIEVESTPGVGSTFRIYFPAVDAPAANAMASAPEAAPVQGKGKSVLYLDDEEAIIFLMKRLLERKGYRVTGFTEPAEALEAVRANPGQFDLAVTDYYMPGMSGLEVAQALKKIRPDLPVVMASGYISDELRAEAPAVGIRELIYKPNTVEDLCEAVARFANAQSADKSPV
jgi:PAS domain S-box-containing protein